MGRLVGVAVSLVSASIAAADNAGEPVPIPAAADTSWYGQTRPASPPAPTEQARRQVVVNRNGVFALGGITFADNTAFLRTDVGAPVPIRLLPRLRALASFEVSYDNDGSGAARTQTADLGVGVGVQNDWRLPIRISAGDFFLVAGTGLGRAEHWVRMPDEPFWPSSWESATVYTFRLDLAAQFRSRRGLIISLQPLGLGFPLNKPEPPDPRWMAMDPHTRFAVSLVAGYQLQ